MNHYNLISKIFPTGSKWSFTISLEDGTPDGYFLCGGTRDTQGAAKAMMKTTLEEYRRIYANKQKEPA